MMEKKGFLSPKVVVTEVSEIGQLREDFREYTMNFLSEMETEDTSKTPIINQFKITVRT